MTWIKRNLRLIVCFALLAAALAGACAVFGGKAVAVGSWGLSFQTEGETPVASASQTVLSQYNAAFVGNTEEPVLYLTFDAGYENGYTASILDTLQKHNVKAAFFLVGNYLQKNGDLVRRMVEEGHIVGNHTMTHPDMSAITDKAAFEKELAGPEALFQELTGKEMPRFYRPPRGVYSEENLKMAQELGYHTVFWSLAYKDWENNKQPTAEYAMGKLIPRTHNGAVILLHSTSKTNAQVLDELLNQWEALGYRFETIDKLFPTTQS